MPLDVEIVIAAVVAVFVVFAVALASVDRYANGKPRRQ